MSDTTNATVDQVYAPPAAPLSKSTDDRNRMLRRWRNVLLLVALVVQVPVLFEGAMLMLTFPAGLVLVAVAGLVTGRIAYRNGRTPWQSLGIAVASVVGLGVVHTALSIGAELIASYLGNGFRRGRQVRDKGALVLAPLGSTRAWHGDNNDQTAVATTLDTAEREALADQWRDNGLTEHASVIAFAKLTLELVELGAPAELVMDAQRDGLDESRHTQLCFALAHAIDGRSIGPTGFPVIDAETHRHAPRLERLQRLAVDSLFDGVIHEGVSARIVARLAKTCEVSAIKEVLTTIARDEGRHAAHADDVLAWCIGEGGDAVRDAVRGALDQIPSALDHGTSERAASGAWERYGIAGNAFADAAYAETLELVRRRYAKRAAA